MKKLLCVILALLLTLPLLTGCGFFGNNDGIRIVCTTFAQYDWIKNIIGDCDTIELSLLIQNGSDPHSYQPTAADIMSISNCDMIVTVGGDSETWVNDAIERSQNKELKKIELATIEGMTLHEISSSSHSHSEHDHGHDHHDCAFDEHLWLSLNNAMTAVSALTEEICKLDKKNAETYRKNAENYLSKLSALDEEYKNTVEKIPEKDRFVLFADRFPFVYLLADYEIEYQAAFEGCTTDVDATFDTVITLIKAADSHGVSCIAVTESSDKALAKTVMTSTAKKDLKTITLNSLQRVKKKDADNGVSYLGVRKENLSALKSALGA